VMWSAWWAAAMCSRKPSSPGGSTRAYRKARATILSRAFLCAICGQPEYADDRFEADHIVPVSRGGSDHPSNLRAAHRSCNLERGNYEPPPRGAMSTRFRPSHPSATPRSTPEEVGTFVRQAGTRSRVW
jgi:5-methylcytosine-specific restriction endonuclease McrA